MSTDALNPNPTGFDKIFSQCWQVVGCGSLVCFARRLANSGSGDMGCGGSPAGKCSFNHPAPLLGLSTGARWLVL